MDEINKVTLKVTSPKEEHKSASKEVCGIVMPISAIDDCSTEHWSEVREIIMQSIETAGFEGRMVNDADDVGVIHKRIIQNLYDDPIVVCDVSGKNSNVMFELGMRLAFDKPTIIIKDEKTGYSFDTSSIEHIEYPRDLRFSKINEFKEKLSHKISSTYKSSRSGDSYTTFLKHFGEFKVAKIDQKVVSSEEYIMEELKNIRSDMRYIVRDLDYRRRGPIRDKVYNMGGRDFCCKDLKPEQIEMLIYEIKARTGVDRVEKIELHPDHYHIEVFTKSEADNSEIKRLIRSHKDQYADPLKDDNAK